LPFGGKITGHFSPTVPVSLPGVSRVFGDVGIRRRRRRKERQTKMQKSVTVT
jgi:hypothetical protein